jgi:hypothetical protein
VCAHSGGCRHKHTLRASRPAHAYEHTRVALTCTFAPKHAPVLAREIQNREFLKSQRLGVCCSMKTHDEEVLSSSVER